MRSASLRSFFAQGLHIERFGADYLAQYASSVLPSQRQALVPGSYFLVTFTLPAELRTLVWQHQRLLYAALMDCTWQTLRTFSLNHRQLQGSAGAVAVLHAHSRKLDFHPHVHLAMPAAALDANKGLWRTLRKSSKGDGYLFNYKALAKVFRAKFLAAVGELGLALPPDLPDAWVVDCNYDWCCSTCCPWVCGGHAIMVFCTPTANA